MQLTCQYCGIKTIHKVYYHYELSNIVCKKCGQKDFDKKELPKSEQIDYYSIKKLKKR